MAKKTAPNDNSLAVVYCRYSSHSQNEASIEQQLAEARKHANDHGLTIVKEYADAAKTGTNSDRPGFQLMLSEIERIKPSTLIVWKTDRLGRNRYDLMHAKKAIRDAGCSIRSLTECSLGDSPEAVLLESLYDGMAEYYSEQLSQNIQRGMKYNAENALSNGYKILGFRTGEDKRYEADPDTAPIVMRIFSEYIEGVPMTQIAESLNAEGLTTSRGGKFNINGLRKTLKNRAYIGEYRYNGTVIEGGMPAIIDEDTFNRAQAMLEKNKRKGAQRARDVEDDSDADYWLTGKLFCGKCKQPMRGVSSKKKNGKKHRYYYCADRRKKKHQERVGCDKKPVRKEIIEALVLEMLEGLVHDQGNIASLAIDLADHYAKYHADNRILDSLLASKKEVDDALANIMKAIEQGIFNDTTQARMMELEEQSKKLAQSIEAEHAKASIASSEHTIGAYFNKYIDASLDNPETRNMVLDYFVDKIYLYEDTLTITCWYGEGYHEEVDVEDFEVDNRYTLRRNWFNWFDPYVLCSTIRNVRKAPAMVMAGAFLA